MKTKLALALVTLLLPFSSFATKVAVVDSGTDFSHEWMKGRAWINEKEIAGNMVDDDKNGKVDDVNGWNFADQFGQVFFPDHLNSVDPSTFKFFEVIARIQAKTATADDKVFWDENVLKLTKEQKEALLARLNFYGEYAHSTHVSGIVAMMSPNSKIMSARVFADTPPENLMGQTRGISDWIYKILAAVSNGMFDQAAAYLNERKADVANYSLGISLQNLAKMALGVKGNKNPTPEQIAAETKKIGAQYAVAGQKWMASSPGTLFVIAAGNDGTNNDELPTFPANVRVSNEITVAASQDNTSLADFSNYGEVSVDIAAPGVAIMSSVPSLDHKQVLPLSGTSMAAPYITGVAAHIKEVNPALTPQDVKAILMGSVDKKDWLQKKVVSAGVVNPPRAYVAAENTKTMSLSSAIADSKVRVKDQAEVNMPTRPGFVETTTPEMREFAHQLLL